jgi:hypothetical protein
MASLRRIITRIAAASAMISSFSGAVAVRAGADSPNIHPNSSGVPGLGSLRDIAGGIATAALIACGIALIVSAVMWSLGSHSQNFQHTQKGKNGVLYSCGAAVLIGGVNLIIAFWNNIGTALH